jgi:hypothetical protein
MVKIIHKDAKEDDNEDNDQQCRHAKYVGKKPPIGLLAILGKQFCEVILAYFKVALSDVGVGD